MNELTRIAIVGTAQSVDASRDVSGTPADALLEKLALPERERALLLRAGGAAVLRRAGRMPARGSVAAEPAAPETLQATSPRLSALLRSMLEGIDDEALPEALEAMARAKLRLPHDLLPLALRVAGSELRARIAPVIGARGAWLAKQDSVFAWAASEGLADSLPQDAEARWDEATSPERKALLTLARRTDPARARALVQRTWKTDKAEQRFAHVQLLGANLGDADIELLESMLGDRSAPVKGLAAELLTRLPASKLALRMRERLDALLRYQPPRTSLIAKLKSAVGVATATGTLDVKLPPETLDAEWLRDGITEAAPHGTGRRQFWLAQLVACVAPDHHAQRFGLTPAEVCAIAAQNEHGAVLIDGLTRAALGHHAKHWYAPLWDAWSQGAGKPVLTPSPLGVLTGLLDRAELDARVAKILDGGHGALLVQCARPWPEGLARAVLARMTQSRENADLVTVAALAIPIALLPGGIHIPELPPDADYHTRAYVRALERFQSLAALRRSIAQEIAT